MIRHKATALVKLVLPAQALSVHTLLLTYVTQGRLTRHIRPGQNSNSGCLFGKFETIGHVIIHESLGLQEQGKD